MVNKSTEILFFCLLLMPLVFTQNPCPVENNKGTVFTGQIIVSERGGFVPLIQTQDTQCYNYSLQYSFYRVPDVAIAVYDFEADKTESLHYFIKPLQSKSLSFIPFIIHTSWPYTKWIRISFSFLAQDKPDFEAGYFQVDTGLLASCLNGKVSHVLLPFRTSFDYHEKIHHHVFLHGFEINTQKITQQSRSPFEVQLTVHNINSTGIALTLSVTTITQVNFLYVSYLAYQVTTLDILAGSYVYEGDSDLMHIPPLVIGRNYARIHGISGFVINYNYQKVYFAAQWTGAEFIFNLGSSQRLIQYLGYEYIFFAGSNCKDCPGYSISYNNTCVRYCPADTYLTPEGYCLSCGEGRIWNGTSCQKSCPKGQYLNVTTQDCQCPNSMSWNGHICIACTQGKVFNETSFTCECPYPLRWNGFICARIAECTGGKQWDVYSYSCRCPSHMMERSGKCVEIPRCLNGQILSGNRCVCPPKTYWNGKSCTFTNCVGSQTWNGVKCVCRSGFFFNGKTCIQCINGQVWNSNSLVCQCQDGYKWNGNFCQKQQRCSGGRIWNSTYEQCICPDDHVWAGNHCKLKPTCCCGQRYDSRTESCQCSSSAKWNGTACVTCRNGRLWDSPSRTCVCPPGTKWDNRFCSVIMKCGGGMMWNQNTWACECPSATVWNGHFCISNPCSKGRKWNDTYRSCQCPDNKIWQNEACIPPKVLCTNGQIWDPTIYACICPPGTFPSINSCDSIPFCHGDQVYNPYNNKCQCPYGLQSSGNRCVHPSCPQDLAWNGYKCIVVNCPPLTIFKNGKCEKSDVPQEKCQKWEYWNGKSCRYFPKSCPLGTNWNGTHCSSVGTCVQGYFKGKTQHCQPFPQLCLPPTIWNGQICKTKHNQCPDKTFYNGSSCMPYVPCQNGKIWSSSYLYCVCPQGTEDNGDVCLACPNQKRWVPGAGCQCPKGKYDVGSNCEIADKNKCKNIPNSLWKDGLCVCKPGYIVEGIRCVCKGFDKGTHCEQCTHKPHSEWKNGLCQCYGDYTDVLGTCVPNSNGSGNDNPSECSVGTYFDSNLRKCLPCIEGCLSCDDCYTCKICRPQFNYFAPAERCIEHCGDGKKFIVECDDGNNKDGDGCSLDCKIESGYACTGGTPTSKDNCRTYRPSEVSISQSGQIRLPESIILNIRINFVPKELLQSFDCNNQCENVLVGEIVSGDQSSTSMKSKYISGTSFSFSFEIEFGRTYIGKFTIRIKINPVIATKYYGGASSGQMIQIDVNPAYLAKENQDEEIL